MLRISALLLGCLVLSCAESDARPSSLATHLADRQSSEVFADCIYTSPVTFTVDGENAILVADQAGTIAALDPRDLSTKWTLPITPDAPADRVVLLSTPAVFGERAVFGWQEVQGDWDNRIRHRVAVVDLRTGAFDAAFAPLDLEADEPTFDGTGRVRLTHRWQLMRSEIEVEANPLDASQWERAYVSLGNGPSRQPFHGWVFELDLAAWQAGGEPTSGVLLTTQENECGGTGSDSPGNCGGGVWNAAGLERVETDDGVVWLVPTGNGRIDYDRGAYAHSVLRVKAGLDFDPGCDESLCLPMDELNPDPACLASCQNVFTARLPAGAPALAPEDGTCDGLGFVECYAALDGDLGASAPVVVDVPEGPRVVVQPGKDGALYLFDFDHMGTLYERVQLHDFCGTADDACTAFWIGIFVTKPALAYIEGVPHVIVNSVMSDRTHYSGMTAMRVVMNAGRPSLELAWSMPARGSAEGRENFRYHGGRPLVVDHDGEPHVYVVETRRGERAKPPGLLWGVRVRDGKLTDRVDLSEAGQRFALPLEHEGKLFVSVCPSDAESDGRVDAFTFRRDEE